MSVTAYDSCRLKSTRHSRVLARDEWRYHMEHTKNSSASEPPYDKAEIGDSIACELHTVNDRLLVSKLTTQEACDRANELLRDPSKGWYVIKHHDNGDTLTNTL